jgi:hypothetical protein
MSVRLIMSVPGESQVFHTAGNNTVCLATPIQMLRFDRDYAAAIATIIAAYPNAVTLSSLPMPGDETEEDMNVNRLLLGRSLLEAAVVVVVST